MATDTLTSPVITASASRPNVYRNFIDGEWVEAPTGETFENRNPADTRDVVGIFQKSSKSDFDSSSHATRGAFLKWPPVPSPLLPNIIYHPPPILPQRHTP